MSAKKNLGLFVSLAAVFLIVGAGCNNRMPEPVNPNNQTSTQTQSNTANNPAPSSSTEQNSKPAETGAGTEVVASTGISAADVAKHSTKADCYIIVRTNVYNVTAMIDKHPGGADKIIPLCGKDATAAFTGQHGGMEMPEKALASMKIGDLKK